MKRLLVFCALFFAWQATAGAQPGTVEDALSELRKGDSGVLHMDRYTDPGASAVAFLDSVATLDNETIRLKVVQFSAALMWRAARSGGRQVEPHLETFVVRMARVLEKDSSERVREAAALGLVETVSPIVLDRHQADLRLAAEKRRDIATLLAYASLPSSDAAWVGEVVRTMKPESRSEKYQLDSLLARFGDQAASDRLIEKATTLQVVGYAELEDLVAALAYVPSEQVRTFLCQGLRSDAVVSLAGGGTIPWRNCCARALVRMHRPDESYPVKNEEYAYSDDDLDRTERWCIQNLGISFPVGVRKDLRSTPGYIR